MNKYINIEKLFEKNRNKTKAVSMSKYMQNNFHFMVLLLLKGEKIYNEFLNAEKMQNGVIDWNFLFKCYQNEHREFQYFVCDYLLKLRKYFLCYENISKN